VDNKFDELGVASLFFGCPGHARKTDDRRHPTLPGRAAGDSAAEPIIRELLGRAVGRLRLLCATLLYKSHPRLTRPPLNLETDELLGGVVLTRQEI
jgi:hypothetical protein